MATNIHIMFHSHYRSRTTRYMMTLTTHICNKTCNQQYNKTSPLNFREFAALVFEDPAAVFVVIDTSVVAIVIGIVLSLMIYVQPSSTS